MWPDPSWCMPASHSHKPKSAHCPLPLLQKRYTRPHEALTLPSSRLPAPLYVYLSCRLSTRKLTGPERSCATQSPHFFHPECLPDHLLALKSQSHCTLGRNVLFRNPRLQTSLQVRGHERARGHTSPSLSLPKPDQSQPPHVAL